MSRLQDSVYGGTPAPYQYSKVPKGGVHPVRIRETGYWTGSRPYGSFGGRCNRTPRDDGGGKVKEAVEDSLVNVTRPGYIIFSRSFSDEVPSTPFSPSGVAVDRTGTEGGEDETPSRFDREARVGTGSSLLPTGRSPGDAGLAKESSYS